MAIARHTGVTRSGSNGDPHDVRNGGRAMKRSDSPVVRYGLPLTAALLLLSGLATCSRNGPGDGVPLLVMSGAVAVMAVIAIVRRPRS